MKKLVLLFGLLIASPAFAADNAVIVTPGVGVTMRSKDIGAGVQSMIHMLGDAAGASIYGVAGTANANILSVQGIASMTPLLATVTGTVAATQSGTWNVTNISGTVSLPTGASTSANQTSELTKLDTIITNTGAALPLGTNSVGQVGFDPSSGKGTPTFAFLALPATTTTQIVALNGVKLTYVTFAKVFAGGTVNVTFKYGTGVNCATGITTLEGPYPLTAQAGWTEGSGTGPVIIVPSGQALCVTTDASVSGGVKLIYQQI